MPVRIIPQTTIDYEAEDASTEDEVRYMHHEDYVYPPLRRVKKPVDRPTRIKLQVIPVCDIRMLELRSMTIDIDIAKSKYNLTTNQYRSIAVNGKTGAGYTILDHWEINPMIDGFVKAQLDIDITGIYAMIDRLTEACDNWIMPLLRQWQVNATTLDIHAPTRRKNRNRSSMFE